MTHEKKRSMIRMLRMVSRVDGDEVGKSQNGLNLGHGWCLQFAVQA